MPRLGKYAALLLLLLGLLVGGLGSPASARVYAAALPTVAQVAGFYPGLAGGSRQVYNAPSISLPGAECLQYDATIGVRSGKDADYFLANGDQPSWAGQPNPGVAVYELRSRLAAKRAFGRLTRTFVRCEGTHTTDYGSRRLRKVWVPTRVGGDQRLAVRSYEQDFQNGTDSFTFEIYVRSGRRIVRVTVTKDADAPANKPAYALTRLAVKRGA